MTTDLDQLCFLHIPKTAGTSLVSLLSDWYSGNQVFPGANTLDYEKFSTDELQRYRLFKGHIKLAYARSKLPQNTKYVSLLREPIERAISLYYFWKDYDDRILNDPSIDEAEKIGPITAKKMDIVEFFTRDDLHMLILRETRNGQLSYLSSIKDKNSLIRRDNKDNIVKDAFENLKHLSVVGVQSQFAFFIYELKQLLNISTPIAVPRVNVSQRESHFTSLDESRQKQVIELISDNNRAELMLYEKIERQVYHKINDYFNGILG